MVGVVMTPPYRNISIRYAPNPANQANRVSGDRKGRPYIRIGIYRITIPN